MILSMITLRDTEVTEVEEDVAMAWASQSSSAAQYEHAKWDHQLKSPED